MDVSQGMSLSSSGSPSYYSHIAEITGSATGLQTGSLYPAPPGFRSLSNPNLFPLHSNATTAFSNQPPSHDNFGPNINVELPQVAKKKRGRPRKDALDAQVSLALSPFSVAPETSLGSDNMSHKRGRGRPPGSGRKQQLSLLGEWMNTSAGFAFAPHLITIAPGEDIVAEILKFSHQRPRALCILSGSGSVSSVTLQNPASSATSLTYQGNFQILCLSGSYLVNEDERPRSRTGGLSVSVCNPHGEVVGGAVTMLIAATPIQVVLCSFVYDSSKAKAKAKQADPPKPERDSAQWDADKPTASKLATTSNNMSFEPLPVSTWTNSEPVDQKNGVVDFDLSRG